MLYSATLRWSRWRLTSTICPLHSIYIRTVAVTYDTATVANRHFAEDHSPCLTTDVAVIAPSPWFSMDGSIFMGGQGGFGGDQAKADQWPKGADASLPCRHTNKRSPSRITQRTDALACHLYL